MYKPLYIYCMFVRMYMHPYIYIRYIDIQQEPVTAWCKSLIYDSKITNFGKPRSRSTVGFNISSLSCPTYIKSKFNIHAYFLNSLRTMVWISQSGPTLRVITYDSIKYSMTQIWYINASFSYESNLTLYIAINNTSCKRFQEKIILK